jgi:hypothetical protein
MSVRQIYGKLYVVMTVNHPTQANSGLTVALMAEAHAIRVISTWDWLSTDPQYLLTAMNLLGEAGWCIDQGKWVKLTTWDAAADLNLHKWLDTATSHIPERGKYLTGWTEYHLKKTAD